MNNTKKSVHRLRNFGNTCYINSTIQVLTTIPELCNELQKYMHIPIAADFIALCGSKYNDALPRFVRGTRLGGGQHDMHEYLLKLLDVIHKSCNIERIIQHMDKSTLSFASDTLVEPSTIRGLMLDSPIVQLFTGQYRGVTQCTYCQNTTDTFESFRAMELSLPNTDPVSIYNVLDSFSRIEEISNFHCDNCRQSVVAHRRMVIWRLPVILILNIRRIGYDGRKDSRDVLSPEVIDIGQYTQQGVQQYKLFAISYHEGTAAHGHYFSVIRRQDDWIKCDDTDVKYITAPPSGDQYLFFYQKIDAT